ncbi:acyl transferase/acyl hydrolase/lysophospholipase [Amylocarpus encephaloides]|uniref:Acyl transferase/acyl hydrolase/lysophospholipase n=1 Tax=Amylocarpus encephaloides TaxID=45428 RepID=A0A9P8C6I3_9HELO|nr:acyl transferase/acyl hydrolase/lysophospholipase [Amylocarpus encephaloides]
MDVEECITAYSDLAEAVFSQKTSRLPFNLKGKVKEKFDSSKLENAIREMIKKTRFSETELLNDETERECRTFVCTVDQNTKSIVRLRSYTLPDESSIPATMCQAALAISAATTFFEPVRIGNRTFVDGGLGVNNPVDEVEGEATNIWCSESGDLKPLVKCFISIGTGNPGIEGFKGSIFKFLSQTVVGIATETEETEKRFIVKWRKHFDENRYFRFNVDQGLQSVGLDEYKQHGVMESVTERYLVNQVQKNRMRDCIKNLRLKESVYIVEFHSCNQAKFGLMPIDKTEPSFAAVLDKFGALSIRQQIVMDKTPWVVPFEKNGCFTRRESELTQLEKMLFAEGGWKKIAVSGLGGLQLPGWDKNDTDPRRLLQSYLSQASAGQWLLVFDNADDLNMWIGNPEIEQESSHLIECLPKSQDGRIIFTTRDRKTAYELVQHEKHIVEVPELSEAIAIGLLQKYLPKHDLGEHEEDAKSLLKQLTYLPLAIVQAASYINKNRISLTEYLLLLADQEEEVINLLSEHFQDDGRYHNVKNPVATTWLISFEQIRHRDPLAAELLSFMACLDSKDIPLSLLPPGPSRKKKIDAIGTLEAYSFIHRRQVDLSLDIHRLYGAQAIRLAWKVGMCLHSDGRLREAEDLGVLVLETSSRVLGQDHPETLASMANLALTYQKQGRLKEAEDLFILVLEMRKRVLGQEHPGTLTMNLASVYWSQDRLKEVEDLSVLVLETRMRVLGQEHPETLGGMANLASTYWSQDRLKEAEDLSVLVLETRMRVLGQEHPDTLATMEAIGLIKRDP